MCVPHPPLAFCSANQRRAGVSITFTIASRFGLRAPQTRNPTPSLGGGGGGGALQERAYQGSLDRGSQDTKVDRRGFSSGMLQTGAVYNAGENLDFKRSTTSSLNISHIFSS